MFITDASNHGSGNCPDYWHDVMVAGEGSKQVMFAGREVPNNQSFLVDVIFFSVLFRFSQA